VIRLGQWQVVGILPNADTMAGTVLVAILLLVGCSGIGPPTVTRDRFDYTAVVAESWKSQMLLNLVKLRYSDAPVFLDVRSSVAIGRGARLPRQGMFLPAETGEGQPMPLMTMSAH